MLTDNSNNKNLQVVNVSWIDETMYKDLKYGSVIAGYEVVATYSGNVMADFKRNKTVKHGAKVMQTSYNPQRNTTAVTYFFDNRDSLNAEDAHYRALMFRSMLAARVKNKIKK